MQQTCTALQHDGPNRLGFARTRLAQSFSWFLDLCVDLFYIVDVFYNFRLAHYDKHGDRVDSGRALARGAALKRWHVGRSDRVDHLISLTLLLPAGYLAGWFAFDFFAAFPVPRRPAISLEPLRLRTVYVFPSWTEGWGMRAVF